jgi:hypothetical protein
MYNLTDNQKKLAKWLVKNVKEGNLDEEFKIELRPANFKTREELDKLFAINSLSPDMEVELLTYRGTKPDYQNIHMTQASLQALVNNDLLRSHVLQEAKNSESKNIFEGSPVTFTTMPLNEVVRYSLTGSIYKAVDDDFNSLDTSFVDYLTPLANPSDFDEALTKRCFPILATGGSDPILWDSAVRTAGVILEERLHDVGAIYDPSQVGRSLVNVIFGKTGTLASKFTVDAEREGYRELYSGIVGAFRNPSAHRLIDPSPEEGGAFIVFVNLLLKKLEDLR